MTPPDDEFEFRKPNTMPEFSVIRRNMIRMRSQKPDPNPNLEGLLKSDRYFLTDFIKRGHLGAVYIGYDDDNRQEVAIKIIDPDERGRGMMEHRDLTEDDIWKKEGGQIIDGCPNLTSRRREKDNAGKRIIVMANYQCSLGDLLEDALAYRDSRVKDFKRKKNPERIFASGLTTSEVIDYATQIIKGIAQYHNPLAYGKPHCDVKPDNILFDYGRLALTDFGTSTYEQFDPRAESERGARDNLGNLYIRSPRLFIKGQHPAMGSDAFSFASTMYKLFTGEFIFQKEIDNAIKKVTGKEEVDLDKLTSEELHKAMPGIREFMKQLYDTRFGIITANSSDMNKVFDEKFENENIPEEFKDFMKHCLHEYPQEGGYILANFNDALKKYTGNELKREGVREYKSKLLDTTKKWGLIGTGAAIGIGAMVWMIYVSPKPDYDNKTDTLSRISHRIIDTADVRFEIDHPYEDVMRGLRKGSLKDLKSYRNSQIMPSLFSKPKDTVMNRIMNAWVDTGYELGNITTERDREYRGWDFRGIEAPRDTKIRWRALNPGISSSSSYLDDYLLEIMEFALERSQVEEDVFDLEKFAAITYLGSHTYQQVTEAANSFNLDDFVEARDRKGKYLLTPGERKFLKRVVYNLSTTLEDITQVGPQNTRLK